MINPCPQYDCPNCGHQMISSGVDMETFSLICNERDNLSEALDESIKLQAHYADLLNMYDNGLRTIFKDKEQWMARLKEMKK